MKFLAYVDRVLLARDVTPDYAAKVRYCCRRFCLWLGCEPDIGGVESAVVNAFLVHLQSLGRRPDTVAGYRRAILVVWNEAYREGDNEIPPLRVRRIKTPRQSIQAFSHKQIITVLDKVKLLDDFLRNGVRRGDFWEAAINSAYSTGLRRGDLLRVKRSQIDSRGVAHILQNKTGYPITVRFNPDALAAMVRMPKLEYAIPWPYHPNALSRQFRIIAKSVGLNGQFKWLRRSAGSYAERDSPGSGSRVLGHQSARIFHVHYEDHDITGQNPVEPPPLGRVG